MFQDIRSVMMNTVNSFEFQQWLDNEIKLAKFPDKRLTDRFKVILEQLWHNLGQPLPVACQDWASTKAAYRFLSNDKVTEHKILHSHFNSTKLRVKASKDPWILVIQDTTEFSYQREDINNIGMTKIVNSGMDKEGRMRFHTLCGVLMHSSLAVTPNGLPLGLCAVKFWNRKNFKGTTALKKKINPVRVNIKLKESFKWLVNLKNSTTLLHENARCVHVGDRESDIFELFCLVKELNTHFLIRSCNNRMINDELKKIQEKMSVSPVEGKHFITLQHVKDEIRRIRLNIKFQRMELLPSIDKQKKYSSVMVTVIDAMEHKCPKDREPIFWRLITDLEVNTIEAAIEKIEWYQQRWKIEVYHKILKSGLRAEEVKLREAQRLINLLSIFCILSWRIFWMTMINRVSPNGSPELILTEEEINVIDMLDHKVPGRCKRVISEYILKLAKLGVYVARAHDPPPGNMVIWRGLKKLNDIILGYNIGRSVVKKTHVQERKNINNNSARCLWVIESLPRRLQIIHYSSTEKI